MALLDLFSPSRSLVARTRPGLSIVRMFDVWRSRRALAQLDETRLQDIGIDPAAAQREARKPVWDVPENWRN